MGGLSGVLCRGRGPPLWQGCCGREEQALPDAGPAPPLPCLPNPNAPAAVGVGSRGEEDPQHSLKLPSKGSNTPNPSRPKPTEQFLTASRSKGFALLRLYRCFTSLKIFSGIQPRLPVAAAAAQVPSLALKDTRSRLQP